ncbi:3852_t:CDS:2, partial [Paraglomus occultum]
TNQWFHHFGNTDRVNFRSMDRKDPYSTDRLDFDSTNQWFHHFGNTDRHESMVPSLWQHGSGELPQHGPVGSIQHGSFGLKQHVSPGKQHETVPFVSTNATPGQVGL